MGCRDLPEADAGGIQRGDDRADRRRGVVGAGGERAADAGCLDHDVAETRDPRDGGADGDRVGLDERHAHGVAVERALQLFGRALHDRATAVDDQQLVGEAVGLLHVVGGEHHGERLLARQPADLGPHRGARLGIEAGRRLVEEQHRRPVHERGRDIQPAAHAARERADRATRCIAQPEVVEQPHGARSGVGGRGAAQPGGDLEVLARREHAGRCSSPARRSRSTRARRRPRARTSCPATRAVPRGRRRQRREDLGGRRLAGAVRAEEAEHAALGHGEAQSVDGADLGPAAAVDLDEVVGDDRRGVVFRHGEASLSFVMGVSGGPRQGPVFRTSWGRTSCGRGRASWRRTRRGRRAAPTTSRP